MTDLPFAGAPGPSLRKAPPTLSLVRVLSLVAVGLAVLALALFAFSLERYLSLRVDVEKGYAECSCCREVIEMRKAKGRAR